MLSQLLQLYHVDGLSSSWSTNWIKGYGGVEGSVRFCMFSQIIHPLLLPPRFCPELLFWRLKANTADSFLTDFALEWWLSKGQSLERFSASSTGFLKTFMWKLLPYFLWKKALVASFKQWVNLFFLSSTSLLEDHHLPGRPCLQINYSSILLVKVIIGCNFSSSIFKLVWICVSASFPSCAPWRDASPSPLCKV